MPCVQPFCLDGNIKSVQFGSKVEFTKMRTKTCYVHFSKHRPSGPMLSISRNVRLSVCRSVCLSVCSLLRYRLTVFLPPLPEVGCQIFLEIRNPWGKEMERSGLTFEHLRLEVVLNCRVKKSFFLLLILPYKTWWKPRIPMDFFLGFWVFLVHPETRLPDGLENSDQRAYR